MIDCSYIPEPILQLIRKGLIGTPTGKTLTLEQIFKQVDKNRWDRLPDPKRRTWGKAFKQCVQSRRITELQLGEKKNKGRGVQVYECIV